MTMNAKFSIRKPAITALLIVLLSGISSGNAQTPGEFMGQGPMPTASDDASYKIGANNLLYIKILGESGIQQTFRVDSMGFITHPLVGRIKIAGMSVSDAEEMLRQQLEGDYILNPFVNIFVLEHSHFSVLGEVRKPGNYELLGNLSIVEAISMAGGFSPVANEEKVKILRRDEMGEKTIVVDVEDIIEGRSQDTYVEAGDVISVPKSFF